MSADDNILVGSFQAGFAGIIYLGLWTYGYLEFASLPNIQLRTPTIPRIWRNYDKKDRIWTTVLSRNCFSGK